MNPLTNSLMVRAADAPAIKPAVELGTPLLLTILGLSHVTDAGFWTVVRYGLTVFDGLRTWTVLTTVLGV